METSINLFQENGLYGIKDGDIESVPPVYGSYLGAIHEWFDFQDWNTNDRQFLEYRRTNEEINEIVTHLIRSKNESIDFIDINKSQPTKDYCRCEVLTDKNRLLEVDYIKEQGIFWDDDGNEFGWIDNGEKPELVLKWREIKE